MPDAIYRGAHDDALLAHAEEAIAEMNARAAEEAAEEAAALAAGVPDPPLGGAT